MPRSEVAALRAVQAVRPAATALPELIEAGQDDRGDWVVTPFIIGVASDGSLPGDVIDGLARLHVATLRRDVPEVPVIDTGWWESLCRTWIRPAVERFGPAHGAALTARALGLVDTSSAAPAVDAALARLDRAMLHGDVHNGNIIVSDGSAHLIDWGSARMGTPLLDVMNLTSPGEPPFVDYLDAWTRHAGTALPATQVALGVAWSRLQIPLQYLPWVLEHLNTAQAEQSITVGEDALATLTGLADG